jgi:poly(A) polymerase Pap1
MKEERSYTLKFVDSIVSQIILLKSKPDKIKSQKVLYNIQEFGSTLLGVENHKSDMDLIVSTYDCLYDRKSFFQALDKLLTSSDEVTELVIVWAANVPLAKFKIHNVGVDLIFADF